MKTVFLTLMIATFVAPVVYATDEPLGKLSITWAALKAEK